jgi:Kelch motif
MSPVMSRASIAALCCVTLIGCSASQQSTRAPKPESKRAVAPVDHRTPPPLTAEMATWHLDQPWSRAVAVETGTQLLLYSGLDHAKLSVARVVAINPDTGQSVPAGTLVHAVHDAAGAVLDGSAVLIGGGEQEIGSRRVVVVSGTARGRALGQLPTPRSDLATAEVAGTAYVVGGYDGATLRPDILATADGKTFTTIGSLQTPVRYPAVASLGHTIYLFGGKTAQGQTTAVQRIDVATGAVDTVAQFPAPIGHAQAVALGGAIYVLGGRIGNGSSDRQNQVTNKIWSFDPYTNTLRDAGTLPFPVADFTIATIGNRVLLLGGEDQAGRVLATVVILHT